ncbi:MAG: hypothetical protein LBG69_02720 [Zoogloeaceae bacterium]|jgi:hypothetical protein|nr:hypothetical protein [Zoogloeaceae bacterium]
MFRHQSSFSPSARPVSPGISPVRAVLAALLLFSFSACVTINVYFPAAAAEKVADKLIDDIWQLDTPDTPSAPQQPAKAQ